MIAHPIGYPIRSDRVYPNRPRIPRVVSSRVSPSVVTQVCGLSLVKVENHHQAVTREAAQNDDDSSLRNPKNGTSA